MPPQAGTGGRVSLYVVNECSPVVGDANQETSTQNPLESIMFGKKNNKSTRLNRAAASIPMFEALEGRQMFSASPLAIHAAAPSTGTGSAMTLTINGTSGGDEIKVFQSGSTVAPSRPSPSTATPATTRLVSTRA
jgi:hypothetical protein